MKKHSTHDHRLVIPPRARKPLTRRELRALLSAADRESLALDLTCITVLAEELG